MLILRLPENIEKRLEALTTRTGRTKSFYVCQAIVQHIEDLEDYYLAVDAYEQHLRSGGKTCSSAEVQEQLDLDG